MTLHRRRALRRLIKTSGERAVAPLRNQLRNQARGPARSSPKPAHSASLSGGAHCAGEAFREELQPNPAAECSREILLDEPAAEAGAQRGAHRRSAAFRSPKLQARLIAVSGDPPRDPHSASGNRERPILASVGGQLIQPKAKRERPPIGDLHRGTRDAELSVARHVRHDGILDHARKLGRAPVSGG